MLRELEMSISGLNSTSVIRNTHKRSTFSPSSVTTTLFSPCFRTIQSSISLFLRLQASHDAMLHAHSNRSLFSQLSSTIKRYPTHSRTLKLRRCSSVLATESAHHTVQVPVGSHGFIDLE